MHDGRVTTNKLCFLEDARRIAIGLALIVRRQAVAVGKSSEAGLGR